MELLRIRSPLLHILMMVRKIDCHVSVAGFVLAHTDKVYKSGTPLTSSKNGRLTKANVFVKLFFP